MTSDLLRRACLAVVLILAVSACVPSQPSADSWRDEAAQSLEDTASAVASAELVLREETRGHLVGRTGVVMLVDAEEAAGATAQEFSALQPPRAEAERHGKVVDALERASGLLATAREARVRGDRATYDELVQRLRRERSRLDELAGKLG